MKWILRAPWVAALLIVGSLVVPAPAGPPSTVHSPTGRTPRLVWTPLRQATWNRMRALNDPWWLLAKRKADATGTKRQGFADTGRWATFVYQVTGDPRYAAKAWSRIVPHLHKAPRQRDWTRENFVNFVIMYDWLYPALTPSQRKDFYETLNLWGDLVLGHMPDKKNWGTRTNDSDEVVGHYFGLAALDLATGPDNPRAGTFLKSQWKDGGKTLKPVGGLDATAADRSTLRNTIRQYAQLAAGGMWIESSMYNLNTLKLLLTDVEAIRTATDKDHFPEIKPLIHKLALEQVYEMTPDLRDSFQWGDEDHPHDLRLMKRMVPLQILSGLTVGDSRAGPYILELVLELAGRYGYRGFKSAEPNDVSSLYFFHPYALHADWRSVLPPAFYAPGMGILLFHDGWRPTDSLFGAHMQTRLRVDHETQYFGDFRLYRRGEWALNHPIGYGFLAVNGEGANTMLLAGLPSMRSTRGPVAEEVGADGRYAYLAGTTCGRPYDEPGLRNVPAFVSEWTRSLVYLPSSDKQSDTVVVYDRVDARDPRHLAAYRRYRAPDRKRIEAAPALKQWLIHSPVAPTVSPSGLAWRTPGGQVVSVRTLLPLQQERRVYNEMELWGRTRSISVKERAYQTRISPTKEADWDTFLNVVHVGDSAVGFQATLIHSSGKAAEGVLVQRRAQDDVVLLFGAERHQRVRRAGYSVAWTGTTPKTTIHLFDLDPSKIWSASMDGATAAVAVSSQGVGHIIAQGAGPHSLRLIAH